MPRVLSIGERKRNYKQNHNTKKKFKSMPTKAPQDRIYARHKMEKKNQ